MTRGVRVRVVLGLAVAAVLALGVLPVRAAVRLPAMFTDNLVLQRDMPVPVWGWADAGEKVTVSVAGQTKTAAAAADGKWTLTLDALKTGGPLTMTVAGSNTITLKNVLVGEVWFCSGQSNMQMSVNGVNQAEQEMAAANYPQIRLISVPTVGKQEPQSDFKGQWAACTPKTVANFSAAGYFFGRELYKNLHVPIGLIHCSWGGSSCEAWVQRCRLEADPKYQPLLQSWDERCAKFDPAQAQAKYEADLAKFKPLAAAAKAAGKQPPYAPRLDNPIGGQHRPANCYNGMLTAVMPYAIRGTIWYQGETNAGRAYQYRELFPLMINSWRQDWRQGDFPFYFVQLANFMAVKDKPADSQWAELREAQTMTLKLPRTGQAVIIDIGDAGNIHPKDKQDVGKRLALIALAKDYCKKVEFSGPVYKGMTCQNGKITLRFDHVGGGLVAKDDSELKGFAIAGADKKFVWATARIAGNSVVVSSPDVAQPVAVRYAWADNPVCNFYNREGLPAGPFRTDDWKGLTAANVK